MEARKTRASSEVNVLVFGVLMIKLPNETYLIKPLSYFSKYSYLIFCLEENHFLYGIPVGAWSYIYLLSMLVI